MVYHGMILSGFTRRRRVRFTVGLASICQGRKLTRCTRMGGGRFAMWFARGLPMGLAMEFAMVVAMGFLIGVAMGFFMGFAKVC